MSIFKFKLEKAISKAQKKELFRYYNVLVNVKIQIDGGHAGDQRISVVPDPDINLEKFFKDYDFSHESMIFDDEHRRFVYIMDEVEEEIDMIGSYIAATNMKLYRIWLMRHSMGIEDV